MANTAYARWQDEREQAPAEANEKQNQAEEELRVVFEELQVLAEELEVANNTLLRNNNELESRVADRTAELEFANASLTSAEAAFRAIADLVPDLLWQADPRGAASWYNKRWYDYTGQTQSQCLERGWTEVVHPDDRDASIEAWQHSVANGTAFEREHRLRASSGEYRWSLVRAEPLREEGSLPLQWFGSITDIHDHRSVIVELEQSEQRLRSLIEGMPQLV